MVLSMILFLVSKGTNPSLNKKKENKMSYTHTNISLETTLDVVSKYKELIEVSADGDSLYIRAR